MLQILRQSIRKWREEGLIALLRASKYRIKLRLSIFTSQLLAKMIVTLLQRSGRIIQAEAVSQSSFKYASSDTISVSISGGQPHQELLQQTGEWTGPPQITRILRDVRLVGPYGLVMTTDGEVVMEGNCNSGHILEWSIKKMINNIGIVITLKLILKGLTGIGVQVRNSTYEHTLSMLNPHANNFFHWTVEHLPRLRSIEGEKSEIKPDDVELLVRTDAPQFVRESLNLLGHTNYSTWGNEIKRIESLVIPDHRLRSRNGEYIISPSDLYWLQNRAVEATKSQNSPDSHEYIYISRKDAGNRRVLNESELIDEITKIGFKRYVLSNMKLEEQIHLFREAEIIIAPHGAGLANMVWAKQTKVIELYGKNISQGRYYLILANELNHKYYSLKCDTKNTDIVAPVDRLTHLLHQIRDG